MNTSSIENLIGPAATIGRALLRKCERLRSSGGIARILLWGPPGTGKTTLAQILARNLAGHELGMEEINGKELVIDKVRALRDQFATASLFSDWRVLLINECDGVPKEAQTLLLTLFDELPKNRAMICTTNQNTGEMVQRYQSRMQQFQIGAPTDLDIATMLRTRGLPTGVAAVIAQGCSGDVRAALNDGESWLDIHGEGRVA